MQRFGEASSDLRGHKTIIRAERKYSRQESNKKAKENCARSNMPAAAARQTKQTSDAKNFR
jgi:hypothetical protein